MRNRKSNSDQPDLNHSPLNPHDKAILAIAKNHFNDGFGDGIDAIAGLNSMLSYLVVAEGKAKYMEGSDYRIVLEQYTRTIDFLVRLHAHTAWYVEESTKGGMMSS